MSQSSVSSADSTSLRVDCDLTDDTDNDGGQLAEGGVDVGAEQDQSTLRIVSEPACTIKGSVDGIADMYKPLKNPNAVSLNPFDGNDPNYQNHQREQNVQQLQRNTAATSVAAASSIRMQSSPGEHTTMPQVNLNVAIQKDAQFPRDRSIDKATMNKELVVPGCYTIIFIMLNSACSLQCTRL